jgi:hypothetical protein
MYWRGDLTFKPVVSKLKMRRGVPQWREASITSIKTTAPIVVS